MTWLIPALIACLAWGIGQVLIKKGLTDVTPMLSNTFFVISALLLTIPYALIGGVGWEYFPEIFVFGLLASLPNLALPYILNKGDVSLTGTVFATYPLYTILLSLFFLKERLDLFQVLGILLIIVGMILVSKASEKSFRLAPWVIWAILAAVFVGFGDFMGKVGLTRYNLPSFLMAYTLGYIPSLLLIKIFDKSKIVISENRKMLATSVLGNLLMPAGLIFLYIAFSKGPASLVSPVASTYPALTAILATIYLKEKLYKHQVIGIVLLTFGIILTSV